MLFQEGGSAAMLSILMSALISGRQSEEEGGS